ncbi:hypothetical protein [Streptomyces atratus]|uniref:hypothetical protein n=1 Tax=Streptomyces atratus TaxID=1893 RepID=UPI002B1E5E6D|nr:hypothetical protein [Streptomyces atratus]
MRRGTAPGLPFAEQLGAQRRNGARPPDLRPLHHERADRGVRHRHRHLRGRDVLIAEGRGEPYDGLRAICAAAWSGVRPLNVRRALSAVGL